MSQQPITERVNPLSVNIDVAAPEEMVKILQKCDQEIFNGWEDYPGMNDKKIQGKIQKIVHCAMHVIKLGIHGAIVFSGCGTSGRLGFTIARMFNEKLKAAGLTPNCHYIMAGGDTALFTSREAIEDDPGKGMELLHELCKDKIRVLYFGITCGFSAPFVAGQIDMCLRKPRLYAPVLVGFNPAELARNLPIEKWDKTFLQVVKGFDDSYSGFILNPIVGPDPIAGSSRMKSGTATMMLLEMILMYAYHEVTHVSAVSVAGLLSAYKLVCEAVYNQTEGIGKVVQMAGDSLNAGGHIYYLSEDSLGIMGMIDASECPPTYGATLDDVRGFVSTGFSFLHNNEGDISHLGKHFKISLADFYRVVAPSLTSEDLVVLLTEECDDKLTMPDFPCKRVCLVVNDKNAIDSPESAKQFDKLIHVTLPRSEISSATGPVICEVFWQQFREMAAKWFLNAVSTGAHILKGKVYQNIMVDLKVSNNKLFHRSVGVIQRFSKLSQTEAQDFLLRSIYETDTLTSDLTDLPVAEHIKCATPKDRVVPTALMAAIFKCSIAEAKAKLDANPVIRTALQSSIEPSSEKQSV